METVKKSMPLKIKHQGHNMELRVVKDSKHYAKMHCVDCDAFVSWAPKSFAESIYGLEAVTNCRNEYAAFPERAKNLGRNKLSKNQRIAEARRWNKNLDPSESLLQRVVFGQYAGTMIKEVPFDYIKWAVINLDDKYALPFAEEYERRMSGNK